MKKQELIHLHDLFARVKKYVEEEHGFEVTSKEYSKLNVRPTSVHRSKKDHQDAVFAIADDVCQAIRKAQADEILDEFPRDSPYSEDDMIEGIAYMLENGNADFSGLKSETGIPEGKLRELAEYLEHNREEMGISEY